MELLAMALALVACVASSFTAAMVWGYFLEKNLTERDGEDA